MNKSLFNKLIKCPYCKGNYKLKRERGVKRYICSRYDNYKECKRIPIDESFLMELLTKRYDKELNREEIENEVEYIEVFDKVKTKEVDVYKLTIHLKNDDPIILGDKLWQY